MIELQEVSKLYGFGDATTVALEDINVDVKRGEFLAIMGPSGSGKSTLMNIIGLLDRPTSGDYLLNNRKVSKFRSNRRAKTRRDHIGFIFQNHNLLPKITVIENVALPLAYKGFSTVKRLEKASSILENLGLKTREYYFPSQLSGGQIQRAAIARALVNEPDIILADEPTGNLDSQNSIEVMNLLKKLHDDGSTILMVTHNPELTKYADRIIYLKDGKVEHDAPLAKNEIVDIEDIEKRPRRPRRKSKKTSSRKPRRSRSRSRSKKS